MQEHKVAVYGSLRQGLGNHGLLAHVREFSKGVTNSKFKMYGLGGFPAITPDEEGAGVVVEVYTVDDRTMSSLDSLEGYSSPDDYWYNRKVVEVELDSGDVVNAWIYFFDDTPSGEFVECNDWYKYIKDKYNIKYM